MWPCRWHLLYHSALSTCWDWISHNFSCISLSLIYCQNHISVSLPSQTWCTYIDLEFSLPLTWTFSCNMELTRSPSLPGLDLSLDSPIFVHSKGKIKCLLITFLSLVMVFANTHHVKNQQSLYTLGLRTWAQSVAPSATKGLGCISDCSNLPPIGLRQGLLPPRCPWGRKEVQQFGSLLQQRTQQGNYTHVFPEGQNSPPGL